MDDEFFPGTSPQGTRDFSHYDSLWRAATAEALARAGRSPRLPQLLPGIGRGIAEVWLSLIPVVVGMGTLALVLAEYTPLFHWLGLPVVGLLELFRLDEPQTAAPLLFVGFTDMFLPALVGASINSELTRFVIATTSISQLIYLSETGALIIKSKLPLGLWQILQIFLVRTAIALPCATLQGLMFSNAAKCLPCVEHAIHHFHIERRRNSRELTRFRSGGYLPVDAAPCRACHPVMVA